MDGCDDRKERYKRLLDKANQLPHLIGHQSLSETCLAVRNVMEDCDNIHQESSIAEKVENTSEVVMDAQLLKCVHESVSKLLLVTSEFTDVMYTNSINALISQNESDNWHAITDFAMAVACPAFTKSSMLGAIDVEPKERIVKERQQRRRTVLAAEKRPENVKQLKRDGLGAKKVNIILKQVSDLFRANNREPIPYYRLIVDPENFMNTVENAFQMAFLARDGNIAIERGSDGYPQVRLASKDELEEHSETSQSICSLNMSLCRDMIRLYQIRKPMLYVPADMDEKDNTGMSEDNLEDD